MAAEPLERVERIAVLRANGLGDLIFSLPALAALRAAYPSARISLLGKRWHRDLLESRPSPVDRVIVVPGFQGVSSDGGSDEPAELERFFEAMTRKRFDLALQMHGGGRFSNDFVRRLGARVTAGFRTPDAPALDRWLTYVYYQPEVLRYLELAGLVGAPPVGLEPRLAVGDEDRAEAALHGGGDGRLVVMHPGATDPRRRWPEERFAALGDALTDAGATIAVTGDESERALAAAVVDAMHAPARDLSGRLSIRGLAGLLAGAGLVVSNDSGPLHLAAAVGALTVGIFWGPNVINSTFMSRARHRPLTSFTRACPRCGADAMELACAHEDSLVADVSVALAVAAARDLLGLAVEDPAALALALDPRARPARAAAPSP